MMLKSKYIVNKYNLTKNTFTTISLQKGKIYIFDQNTLISQ